MHATRAQEQRQHKDWLLFRGPNVILEGDAKEASGDTFCDGDAWLHASKSKDASGMVVGRDMEMGTGGTPWYERPHREMANQRPGLNQRNLVMAGQTLTWPNQTNYGLFQCFFELCSRHTS